MRLSSAGTVRAAVQRRTPTRERAPTSGGRSCGDGGEGVAGRGRGLISSPDQGWTVFHLPSTPGVAGAIGSEMSRRIREGRKAGQRVVWA